MAGKYDHLGPAARKALEKAEATLRYYDGRLVESDAFLLIRATNEVLNAHRMLDAYEMSVLQSGVDDLRARLAALEDEVAVLRRRVEGSQ